MRTYRKIDVFFDGKYLYSTNWYPRCRDAIDSQLETLRVRKHSFPGLSSLESYMLRHPNLFKARFDKQR